MTEKRTELLIAGAGLGGVAGALAALRLGRRVILTEETDWIGGQSTAQAVPPDENPWIDKNGVGGTASYRQFRDRIRDYYRRNYPLLPNAREEKWLNPGKGLVSPLCAEPRVALAATCLQDDLVPRQIRNSAPLLADFQTILVNRLGFELNWPEAQRLISREKMEPLGI